jgi:putative glycosyltransferase (TIGR04348 family)
MLREDCRIIVQTQWSGEPCDALIALHARRSAPSVAAWRARDPRAPLAVMLTGTDLYRDLPDSREAAASLDAADRIVVLQEDAQRLLAPAWRAKSEVIFQSARALTAAAKRRDILRCTMVGHLREEKDPATLFEALRRIPAVLPIAFRHIGAPLDEKLAAQARALERRDARYRYAGALSHGLARCAIRASHLLVHPSVMEGGANVIVEAVTSGTAVVASRVSGNVGMLGAGYPGYFDARDASGLAACLVRAWEERAYLRSLERACAARRALFRPQAEARAVRRLVRDLLAQRGR